MASSTRLRTRPALSGGYLLRAGDRVVLIDAGLGEYEDEQWHGGQFLDSLRGLGVAPAEVTDVVFTHLHWDHFGPGT
jgi:glyoxylase-like metal-dependent hydrolase (beta-lactamase superfamily II)